MTKPLTQEDRRKQLIPLIEGGDLTVDSIALRFGVSKWTIYDDLAALREQGRLGDRPEKRRVMERREMTLRLARAGKGPTAIGRSLGTTKDIATSDLKALRQAGRLAPSASPAAESERTRAAQARRQRIVREWDGSLSSSELASCFGVSPQTIDADVSMLRKRGHELARITAPSPVPEQREQLTTLITNGVDIQGAAAALGLSETTIRKRLKELGAKGEAPPVRRVTPPATRAVASRRAKVARLWWSGLRRRSISDESGLSRDSVSSDIARLRDLGIIPTTATRPCRLPPASESECRHASEALVLRRERLLQLIESDQLTEADGQSVESRRRGVTHMCRAGARNTEIAALLGASERSIRKDIERLRSQGVDLGLRRIRGKSVKERQGLVLRMYQDGISSASIADQLAISPAIVSGDLRELRSSGRLERKSQQASRIERRRSTVAGLWERGHTAGAIASDLGVTESTVRHDVDSLRADGQVEPRQPRRSTLPIEQRRAAASRMWLRGASLTEIAEEQRVSVATTRRDLHWIHGPLAGVRPEDGRALADSAKSLVARMRNQGFTYEQIQNRLALSPGTVGNAVELARAENWLLDT